MYNIAIIFMYDICLCVEYKYNKVLQYLYINIINNK